MANINLISARRADRVRLTKVARGMVVSTVVAGALGVMAMGYMGSRVWIAGGRVAQLDTELAKLRPVLAEIEADEAERKGLLPKLETLTTAQGTTKRWFGIMDGLKRAVPAQTWLTNVSVERAGDIAQAIKLNGLTVDQSRVGETMFRLTQQPDFYKKVDLRYTTTTTVDSQASVEFELAAQLNQPELEPKDGEGNASQTN